MKIFFLYSLNSISNLHILNRTDDQYPCLVKGCYKAHERCDGTFDCDDGSDESDCIDETLVQQELVYR